MGEGCGGRGTSTRFQRRAPTGQTAHQQTIHQNDAKTRHKTTTTTKHNQHPHRRLGRAPRVCHPREGRALRRADARPGRAPRGRAPRARRRRRGALRVAVGPRLPAGCGGWRWRWRWRWRRVGGLRFGAALRCGTHNHCVALCCCVAAASRREPTNPLFSLSICLLYNKPNQTKRPSHKQTPTPTPTHKQTPTPTHTNKHQHQHQHTNKHQHRHTRTNTNTDTHEQTPTPTPTHTTHNTNTNTTTNTNTNTQTNTNTATPQTTSACPSSRRATPRCR